MYRKGTRMEMNAPKRPWQTPVVVSEVLTQGVNLLECTPPNIPCPGGGCAPDLDSC